MNCRKKKFWRIKKDKTRRERSSSFKKNKNLRKKHELISKWKIKWYKILKIRLWFLNRQCKQIFRNSLQMLPNRIEIIFKLNYSKLLKLHRFIHKTLLNKLIHNCKPTYFMAFLMFNQVIFKMLSRYQAKIRYNLYEKWKKMTHFMTVFIKIKTK